MARNGSGGVSVPCRPEIALPELRAYEGGALEADGDYDAVAFTGLDLSGSSAAGATFLDCGVYGCCLEAAGLGRTRLMDSVLEGVSGVGLDLAGALLRDVELLDVRLGGVQAHGASWSRVLVRGGKIEYLNLRQATLRDVTFENCVLVEPDFLGASLERVAFAGCALRGAEFGRATLRDVDLRQTAELDIASGVGRLGGAVVTAGQLMDLAPAFAAEIGVRVEG
jgi:uncharacterized protein YjbI with pentapeptide repeats